jgi:dUTP pyrophosphatase
MSEVTQVQLLNENAKMPQRFSFHAAGHDLYSSQCLTLFAKSLIVVPTGIAVSIPREYYGRIAPRSGLSIKGIDVLGGVIDSDYRGELKVILVNHSDQDHKFEKHDRIAQLIIEKINSNDFVQVENLNETQRGSNGFGSTGN